MKKVIYCVLLLLLPGCSEKESKQPDRLPSEEIPAFREAAMKMTEYIVWEDSAFRLTIPEEKAIEIGIPGKYYKRVKEELDYTNHAISDNKRKGIPVAVDDYWNDKRPQADSI